MGKGKILSPVTSKSLKFFKFELDNHDYVHAQDLHQFKISFQSVQRQLLPIQIGEVKYYGFVTFFLWLAIGLLYFFLGHAPIEPWMDFHGLWLIRRVFAQGRSFWGWRQYRNSFGGNVPQNYPKWGVNRQFQARRAEYKIAISCKI